MKPQKVYAYSFQKIYALYVQKVEKKGRTKEELDTVLCRLTGYDQKGLQEHRDAESDLETFFARAPEIDTRADQIKGVVCGVRVEEMEDPLMRKIRAMDKVVDDLAKGKALEKILHGLSG